MQSKQGLVLVFGPWAEWLLESEGLHLSIAGLLEPTPQ
jgi:hypothetical protein